MNRQQRRAEERANLKLAQEHNNVLIELLDKFFEFLDAQPKPKDEEVRLAFQRGEAVWKTYCAFHNLGTKTSLLFNAKVSYAWKTKYAKIKRKIQKS